MDRSGFGAPPCGADLSGNTPSPKPRGTVIKKPKRVVSTTNRYAYPEVKTWGSSWSRHQLTPFLDIIIHPHPSFHTSHHHHNHFIIMQRRISFTVLPIYFTALVVLLTWTSLAQGAGELHELVLSFVMLMRRLTCSNQPRLVAFQARSCRGGWYFWHRCL